MFSTSREVTDRFGADFAAAIADASVGEWVGPVPSIYGAHLVRIEARQAPYRPGLDEVRDAVERELKAEGRDRARERFYRSLRGDYEVVLPERLSRPAS